GVALRRFAPVPEPGQPLRVALLGTGVQGHAHLAVLGGVLPGCALQVFDRHPDRAAELVDAATATRGITAATAHDTAREAVDGADVVVTAASFAPPDQRQVLTSAWLKPVATVVAVDYSTYVSAEVARTSALFLTDDRAQFLANRDLGNFDGYPDPTAT